MLKKISYYLKRTALALMCAILVWSTPHLKDAHYRYIIGNQVVKIIGETGTGSGFHIKAPSGKTYILTNQHVCAVADKNQQLLVENSEKLVPRRIVAIYQKHDLCLIEALPGEDNGLRMASSITIGEDIVLIGHPSGRPLTLSKGEFVHKKFIPMVNLEIKSPQQCNLIGGTWLDGGFFMPSVCIEKISAFGISSPSYPGNSGSPVVNKWGNVVGVLFAGNRTQLNDSYMVPFHELKNFLKDY
jgi:S1-C subfamily serine protease